MTFWGIRRAIVRDGDHVLDVEVRVDRIRRVGLADFQIRLRVHRRALGVGVVAGGEIARDGGGIGDRGARGHGGVDPDDQGSRRLLPPGRRGCSSTCATSVRSSTRAQAALRRGGWGAPTTYGEPEARRARTEAGGYRKRRDQSSVQERARLEAQHYLVPARRDVDRTKE